jgi:putative flippase GtrA
MIAPNREVTRGKPAVPSPRVARLFGQASAGRYAIIGISGVTLDTVLFAVLVLAGLVPVLATMLGTVAGILNNYLLNARFNFVSKVNLVQGRRFLLVGLFGLLIAAVSLQVLTALGLAPLPAKLVSLPVVLVSQFVANKRWTFAA